MRIVQSLWPLGLLLAPMSALAQDAAPASSQIWVDDVSQVQAHGRDAVGATNVPPADMSASRPPNDVGAAQWGHDRGSAEPVQQLAPATRSSEAPHNLSSKQQGNLPAQVRVEGTDRCDPKQRGAKVDASCAHVIETRSGEFSAPGPAPLTAEQRLLAAQARGERGLAAEVGRESATHLASGAADPNERTSQELAAQLLVVQQGANHNGSEAPQNEILPEGVDSQLIDVLQGLPMLVNQPQ